MPLTAIERKIATKNKAVFLLTAGETKLRVKVKRKDDALKVKVKAKPVMVLDSASCTDDANGTTELATRFELSDDNGDPVVVSHLGTWNCKKRGKKLEFTRIDVEYGAAG